MGTADESSAKQLSIIIVLGSGDQATPARVKHYKHARWTPADGGDRRDTLHALAIKCQSIIDGGKTAAARMERPHTHKHSLLPTYHVVACYSLCPHTHIARLHRGRSPSHSRTASTTRRPLPLRVASPLITGIETDIKYIANNICAKRNYTDTNSRTYSHIVFLYTSAQLVCLFVHRNATHHRITEIE